MNKSIIDLSDRTNMFYWQTNRKISALAQKTIFLDRKNTVSLADTKAAITYGMMQTGRTASQSQVTSIDDHPIPYGSVNNVIKAEITDGTKIVVRMHPYHVQNGYFYVEKIATQEAAKMGVPTYTTYFIDDSKSVFNFDFMIMSQTPGKPLQALWPIDPDQDKILIRETGQCMALIHQVKTNQFGFFLNDKAKTDQKLIGQYTSFKDHIWAGIEEDFKFLLKHDIVSLLQIKQIETILQKHEDLLSCSSPRLIHNDIADWNQLSDGQHITGMMDWDECFSGDPVMDFSQWSLFFDNMRLKYLIEGYQSVSPLPTDYQEKDHLFRLRYVISKLHLRKKRAIVMTDSTFLNDRIKRGIEVLKEELKHFKVK